MGERSDTIFLGDDGGDVLRGVPGCLPQGDIWGNLETFGRARCPQIVLIDGPVVVNASSREQGDVDGVIRMVMREDYIGHLLRPIAQACNGVEDHRSRGHHSRIHNDQRLTGLD